MRPELAELRESMIAIVGKLTEEDGWARMAMMNTACAGKFSSDRTIEEYVRDIWHLKKVTVSLDAPAAKKTTRKSSK